MGSNRAQRGSEVPDQEDEMTEPQYPENSTGQSDDSGGNQSFADFLRARPAMQDVSGHVRLSGRLLSAGSEERFILVQVDSGRVLEGLNTDVAAFRQLQEGDNDLVEVVLPGNAIIREVQIRNAADVAQSSSVNVAAWKDPGYWNPGAANVAGWKDPGYWNPGGANVTGYSNAAVGNVAGWKDPGYWNSGSANIAAWKDPGYWDPAAANAAAWKDPGYWGQPGSRQWGW
jgi:hypothetical protein